MKLRALEVGDAETILRWREAMGPGLRTSRPISLPEEREWIVSPPRNSRWWAIVEIDSPELLSVIGLTNIEWENGKAEMSIMGPDSEEMKLGVNRLGMLAFNELRLRSIYKEVYECDPYRNALMDEFAQLRADMVMLSDRKYFDGQYWDSRFYTLRLSLPGRNEPIRGMIG